MPSTEDNLPDPDIIVTDTGYAWNYATNKDVVGKPYYSAETVRATLATRQPAPVASTPAVAVPEYGSLADHLFVEQRGDGIWLVCVEGVFKTNEDARKACQKWMAAYSAAPPIKVAVDRFLGWKLPEDFGPDAGISFDRSYSAKWGMPIGTNLLTADQAKAMFEYCLAPQPAAAPVAADVARGEPEKIYTGGRFIRYIIAPAGSTLVDAGDATVKVNLAAQPPADAAPVGAKPQTFKLPNQPDLSAPSPVMQYAADQIGQEMQQAAQGDALSQEADDAMVDAFLKFTGKTGFLSHPDVPYEGDTNVDNTEKWRRKLVKSALSTALAQRAASQPDSERVRGREAARTKLSPMQSEEDQEAGIVRQWYFDCDGHYIDVALDDGKYSIFFRDRATQGEGWLDQSEQPDSERDAAIRKALDYLMAGMPMPAQITLQSAVNAMAAQQDKKGGA